MKKKVIIIIIVLALLGAATFFIVKKVKQNKTGTTSSGTSSASTFPLKKGSQGNEVITLQTILNKIVGSAPIDTIRLDIDGIFGAKTEQALQEKVGLTQLTKNQYNALIRLTADYVMIGNLYPWVKEEIQNA